MRKSIEKGIVAAHADVTIDREIGADHGEADAHCGHADEGEHHYGRGDEHRNVFVPTAQSEHGAPEGKVGHDRRDEADVEGLRQEGPAD